MRVLATACLVALLSGCTAGKDEDTLVDHDHDGFTPEVDCDDDDASIHPGAAEACDGVDSDCDGEVDEDDAVDASTWYADVDGDGYGDVDAPSSACEQPSGAVADATDCEDADAGRWPGAEEVCNAVDDDCDGEVDEDAVDAPLWYTDADGDGYGYGDAATASCDAPVASSAVASDCDDTDADVHPDAGEICDGEDDDCDGEVDEDGTDAPTWYADGDGDGYGDALATVAACDAPGGMTADDTDCDDAAAEVHPAGVEVCNGVDDDCDGNVDEAATDALTWYTDADGDGYGDAATATASCEAPSGSTADASDCDDTDAAVTVASTWYADLDGDGYGDSATTAIECESPPGYTADASDCDDADGTINPAGSEVCDERDDDCDGLVDEDDDSLDLTTAVLSYADGDGDGYGVAGTGSYGCDTPAGSATNDEDCDDTDAAVAPAAAETCDTIDNDCDGAVDEADAVDPTAWYTDADGDGFGDADAVTRTCEQPSGTVADGSDCDDAEVAVNPDAVERCDGVDNDCEGSTDGADAVDAQTWYADADGDGYGDPAVATLACELSGTVADASDCDDTDALVSPDGIEVCDGIDNDCDGSADGADAIDPAAWYADADSDGFGDADSSTWSCTQPAGTVVDSSDCDDTDATVNPDAIEWCDAVDDDCDGAAACEESLADADGVLYGGAAGDLAGQFVAAVGDVDGDGIGDIGVGSYLRQDASHMEGMFWVASGPVLGEVSLGAAQASMVGASAYDELGWALGPTGDGNHDGFSDFWASARLRTEVAYRGGAVYLFEGPVATVLTSADATLMVHGADRVAACGEAALSDFDADGDGAVDLVVGCPGADGNDGAAYLLFGVSSQDGTVSVEDADVIFTGEGYSGGAGDAFAAGDLDGDGIDDLAMGASNQDATYNSGGAAYVVLAPSTSITLSAADGRFTGNGATKYAGYALAIPGDLDGDGLGDLLVTELYGNSSAGSVWVVRGPATGDTDLASAADAAVHGAVAYDYFGLSLAGPGDVDGDGNVDIVIGAREESTSSGGAGAAYLFLGPITGTLGTDDAARTFLGEDAGDEVGGAVATGDTDGDGSPELLLGATGRSQVWSGDGAVYVVGL